jgi:hypothetical protein
MVVGVYGKVLPNQNGAPVRLVVPWKYGFKGIKSIVRDPVHGDCTRHQRGTGPQPAEYGFFANVNPEVDHPRWSRANVSGASAAVSASSRINALPFNGYAEQVAPRIYQRAWTCGKWLLSGPGPGRGPGCRSLRGATPAPLSVRAALGPAGRCACCPWPDCPGWPRPAPRGCPTRCARSSAVSTGTWTALDLLLATLLASHLAGAGGQFTGWTELLRVRRLLRPASPSATPCLHFLVYCDRRRARVLRLARPCSRDISRAAVPHRSATAGFAVAAAPLALITPTDAARCAGSSRRWQPLRPPCVYAVAGARRLALLLAGQGGSYASRCSYAGALAVLLGWRYLGRPTITQAFRRKSTPERAANRE